MSQPWEDYSSGQSADTGPWQDFAQAPTEQPQAQPEGRTFMEALKGEVKGGLQQMANPMATDYAGSSLIEKIPNYGVLLKNLIGAGLGAGRALYSVPTAATQAFVSDPLRQAGYEKTANATEALLPIALSFLGGGVPGIGKIAPKVAEAAPILENGLAGGSRFLTRVVGRALDPLASQGPTTLQKMDKFLGARQDALGQIAKETDAALAAKQALAQPLEQAQGAASTLQRQMDDLAAATTQSRAFELEHGKSIPPSEPVPPEIKAIPGATPAGEAGQAFRQDVLPGAREKLYAESGARYDALRKQGEAIPIPNKTLDEVSATITKLENESRLPTATRPAAEQLKFGEEPPISELAPQPSQPRPRDTQLAEGKYGQLPENYLAREALPGEQMKLGETYVPKGITANPEFHPATPASVPFEALFANPAVVEQAIKQGLTGPDLVRAVSAHLTNPGNANMGNAIRADQILSSASRQFQRAGDIASRSAVEELRKPILKALNDSPLAGDLATAKALHRQTSELVGPRSLSERVFRVKPEQVVDKIFLPEGQPNVSMISDAKQIYQNVAPGEWPKVVGEALGKLQERSLGNAGQIDPGKFLGQWRRYRSTFQSALEPQAFQAVDGIAQQVQQFNQSRRVWAGQMREASANQAAIKSFYATQRKMLGTEGAQLRPQLKAANEGVDALVKQMKQADDHIEALARAKTSVETFGLGKHTPTQETVHLATSPHIMIAIAQLGQAAQALFTLNFIGAGRQLAQGAMWATMGNPAWLQRIAQNPALAEGIRRAIAIQHGAAVTLESTRYINAATRYLGDQLYQESNPSGQSPAPATK